MSTPKVLIANRSEIACRVMQTCREMGLKSVAIFAPGDEQARHLTYADEVHEVAGYLDISSVVGVAKKSGASLVHPGYGFLSERAAFAREVEAAGLVFVGPRPETMDIMGGKIAAKQLAESQGVPTLPWARVAPGEDIAQAAVKVGFPLLIKASAGGGGKGMRRVENSGELASAAESASAEAVSAFGDGTLFLERLVLTPRHIEVQVFGDGSGGGVHLYERECSLQRRHQKVWEEATAPRLTEATRTGLFTAALQLMKAVKYRSAGTLEFLVDADGSFYFLEMNTRLQVEHPVTELVTGTDLVCMQLSHAMNPKAPLAKVGEPRGHAIEVRLYAEDPMRDFMPTPGEVLKLHWPTGTGIRVESGIEEGQTVGTQFDSMLAKLIVHAPDRAAAINRLRFALEETVILGVGTNQSYLHAISLHPKVIEGDVHTGFLGKEFAALSPAPKEDDLTLLAHARAQGLGRTVRTSAKSTEFPSPWFGVGR